MHFSTLAAVDFRTRSVPARRGGAAFVARARESRPSANRSFAFAIGAVSAFLAGQPCAIAADPQWFTEVTEAMGLPTDLPPAPYDSFQVADVMTAGVAFLDYDGDGRLDLLFTNENAIFEDGGMLRDSGVRLYRQTEAGPFTDVTAAAGVGHSGYGIGIGVGDYNNDGLVDLYFANYGQDYLYRNRGDGTFEDVTEAAGIHVDGWSCSTTFFDYDGDGFLDLFVTQYVHYDEDKRCTDASGRPEFCGPRAFPPAADFLLHNRGDGTFEDVGAAAGIRAEPAAGLGVISLDINLDGLQDLYVTNDSYANHLWINQGNGTFFDDAIVMGTAVNEHGKPEAGMGIVAADFDNDLDFDLFMTHLRKESNTYYRNVGLSWGFEDVTSLAGLANASMPYTGFGTAALDLELDGDLDIVVANGAVNRGDPIPGVEVGRPWNFLCEPNQIFLNDGDGRFRSVKEGFGGLLTRVEMSRGLSAADYDRDGDVDILVANAHCPSRLYRNDAPRQGHWLAVRVTDPAEKRAAIGATVLVYSGDARFLRPIARATSYLSASPAVAHFGLGPATAVDSLRVRWPGGEEEWFPGVEVDREIRLERGQGEMRP